ncbi:hypothetical protein [Geomicrobium sediminis]|uniref:HTH araC/xylS-type domain-containing protein n=1 Tax=Geomicrobium sediminis TaxID=1347788 RepID=A0ABS2PEN2_9BACL|nr:hypothetical protein [Geomicrobium sediminis]MBM7633870.1 hypothetical protein [Geomicrobium sediminis]
MVTNDELKFYIVHHINVLGVKRGVPQVASKLAFDESFIRRVYAKQKRAV